MTAGSQPPIGSQEDKREAVNMGVSLSAQLQSAAFSLVGIVGGFITFMLENDTSWWVYVLLVLGIGCCISSIHQGGTGVTVARNNGFIGDWKIDVTAKYFNFQVIFLGMGALLMIAAIGFLSKDEDLILRESKIANTLLEKNLSLLDSISNSRQQHKEKIMLLESRIDSLEKKMKKLGSRNPE